MSSRVWEFVEEGYGAVKSCLLAYVQLSVAAGEVAGQAESTPSQSRAVPEESLDALRITLGRLKDTTGPARQAIETMKPFVSALEGPLVRFAGEVSPSLAESVVKAAETTVERIGDVDRLDPQAPETRFWLFRLQMAREPDAKHPEKMFLDPAAEAASLDKEAARVALRILKEDLDICGFRFGLWGVLGPEVELQGRLRELHGLSERLLCRLILADGRKVNHQDLAKRVWDDPDTKDHAIHQGKLQLTVDLKALGYPEVAEAIRSVTGGYLLRPSARFPPPPDAP